MALKVFNFTRHCMQHRCMYQSASKWIEFGWNKPVARDEDMAVGYKKIALEASKAGEDPFELDRETSEKICGDGSRYNPFVIPSRNTRRLVLVEYPGNHGGPAVGFWVTREDGGRCPITAQYYKLQYNPRDKWGIDDLDLFAH